jgi:hypothetical protein
MKRGAVAIVDALGFKGIWKRHPAGEVLAKLRGFKEDVAERRADLLERARRLREHLGVEFEIHVTLLSDTVVLGVTRKIVGHRDRRDLNDVDSVALVSVARITAQLLVKAGQRPPALAYRGCIATGEFDMEDTFIIGPAVDEAAQWMDEAEAAVVWLTASAKDAFVAAGFDKDPELTAVLSPYQVPLKVQKGQRPRSRLSSLWLPPTPAPTVELRDTFCVNDLASVEGIDEHAVQENRAAHAKRVLDTFGGGPTPEIRRKQQNTARFYLDMNRSLWPLPAPRKAPPG